MTLRERTAEFYKSLTTAYIQEDIKYMKYVEGLLKEIDEELFRIEQLEK